MGLAEELRDWLIEAGFAGLDEGALVRGLCERMLTAGLPLQRGGAGYDVLHPEVESRGHAWHRDGIKTDPFVSRHDEEATNETQWLNSPFYRLWQSGANTMRRRLAHDYPNGEFALLDRMKAEGATDYMACIARAGAGLGQASDIYFSWMSDAPEGFRDADIALFQAIRPAFAMALNTAIMRQTGRTLLQTYLGAGITARVLAGNVVRGRAESIRAVIWFSDLTGFTRIADTVQPDAALEMLNDYAGLQVRCIEETGGEVLKFIGDGILAIYRATDDGEACAGALRAARMVQKQVARLADTRVAGGLPVAGLHVGLHLGEVLYGNFGSTTRLDFTILGAAVNEASRMSELCGGIGQDVVVSQAVAAVAPDGLVRLGRYALRGVARPQELFTLDRDFQGHPSGAPGGP